MHGFDRNEAGKVFVGGLSWETSKESLLSYFSQYGEVVDCVVMKNPETGKSRGFGFVTYRDTNCVETVLSVSAHVVDGRQVDPKACNPKGPNRGGGGGPGGEGGHRMQRGPRGHDPLKDRKIFIGGLPNNVDEETIKNFFSRYGNVVDVTVMYDAQKQRSRDDFLVGEAKIVISYQVECKRATPRDNRGANSGQQEEQQQIQLPPHAVGLQQIEMGGHPPMQHAPGPVPGPEPSWGPPEAQWSLQPQQSPPPSQLGGPSQFQNVQFPGAFQGDQPPAVQPGTWPPQQPPAQSPGGWPPAGLPPQQPGTPVSAPFLPQPSGAAQTFSSSPAFQAPPGAPVYQWAASPPPGQQPPASGQPPPGAIGQPAPNTYSYAPPTYAAPAVAAAGLAPRPYQEFSNGQVQIATTVTPVQAPGQAPVTTPVTYSAYSSPYVAPSPQAAGPGAPPTDPYAQSTAVAPPQGAVQVAAPPAGQPGTLPGYGSPLGQTPLAASGDPAAQKPVDYSAYYSAYGGVGQYTTESSGYTVGASATPNLPPTIPGVYPQGGASLTSPVSPQVPTSAVAGYGGEPNPAAAAAASAPYSAQPAPAPVPYGGQGEAPQAVAYGGAPGPSPTFQRQSSATQGYHPYGRR